MKDDKKKSAVCYGNRRFIAVFTKAYRTTGGSLDWLTVHRGITLVDFQLDAQNSFLFTYNTFIKILYMF